MLRTAQSIIRDQGTRALWRGNLTNCARYFPTQAINLPARSATRSCSCPIGRMGLRRGSLDIWRRAG